MMRLLPLTLAGLLLCLSLPASAQQEAMALLRDAIQERYGAALGEGELHLSLSKEAAGPFDNVEALNVDPNSRRFAAILRSGDQRMRVEGEIWTEMQVAVPTRRISPGEVITEADLTTIPVRTDQMGPRAINAMADLVGMEARRVLAPGRPVPANSIINQPLVHRNKPVTVEYRQGPLLVTARGRALSDGAKGEQVRIQNLDSNRTVIATVIGPGTVSAAE